MHRPPLQTRCQSQPPATQLAWHTNGKPARTDLDAIIVLAGGLHDDGGLPPWVHRRLDLAAGLAAAQHSARCALLCSGGGTPHRPSVLSDTGYVVFESTSCASYLLDKGMKAASILKETASFDTVGNGYFALVSHAIPAGWRRIAIVTSAFHMPRSRAIFDTCFALAAKDIWRDPKWYELEYYEASDDGLFEQDVYVARVEKEVQAAERWLKDTANFTQLADLHSWLFDTHMCYAVPRQHEFGQPTKLDPRLLASY